MADLGLLLGGLGLLKTRNPSELLLHTRKQRLQIASKSAVPTVVPGPEAGWWAEHPLTCWLGLFGQSLLLGMVSVTQVRSKEETKVQVKPEGVFIEKSLWSR